jgi:hypothetical protein
MKLIILMFVLLAGCYDAEPVGWDTEIDSESESDSDSDSNCNRMCGDECYDGVYCEYH